MVNIGQILPQKKRKIDPSNIGDMWKLSMILPYIWNNFPLIRILKAKTGKYFPLIILGVE